MQETSLDVLDRRLLHALQIEPRAAWTALAPIVGADAATLSRRWQRIADEGLAWSTGILGWDSGALVEVECEPAALAAVTDALVDDPQVATVDRTVGTRDLFLTLIGSDPGLAARFTTEKLSHLPGIRSARTHLVVDYIVEGGAWRFRELTAGEATRIPPAAAPRPRAARVVSPELRAVVGYELGLDGRASAAAIADRHGVSPQRVVDAIATLRASGELRLRTDVARRLSSWPVYAWYFVEVPASLLAPLRTALGKVPEVRLAVECATRYNLILAVWLRSLADISGFEVAMERAAPGARIADRSVVSGIAKHLGHALDDRGQATGRIVSMSPQP